MRRCPATGEDCFEPYCVSRCNGFDVRIEAVTVIHTTIESRRPRAAEVSLVLAAPVRRLKEPA